MKDWKTYAKAIVAAFIAAGAFAIPVVDDGLVPSEVIGIVVAFLTGLGVVYAVPNKPRLIPAEELDPEAPVVPPTL